MQYILRIENQCMGLYFTKDKEPDYTLLGKVVTIEMFIGTPKYRKETGKVIEILDARTDR